jgi:purine-nucleoside/S-methyl-5'-thioadenosine phosphorylase / adenosine deaminase
MALARRFETCDRARFLDSMNIPAEHAMGLHQVHSKTVIVVHHQDPRSLAAVDADGLVTARPDAFLTVTVADCLPIFLVDEMTGAFGLVHSGWKGTGIVVEALRTMAEAFGTKAPDVAAVIGPGIGPCCYTVPRERYERFRVELGEHAAVRGPGGDYRLDLKAANVRLMQSAGVERIAVATDCTCCETALGSFRREGQGFRRMLAFIGRQGEAR